MTSLTCVVIIRFCSGPQLKADLVVGLSRSTAHVNFDGCFDIFVP